MSVIQIVPKKERSDYRGHEITVEFEPASKRWRWRFKRSLNRSGTAKTRHHALRGAKRTIDILIDGEAV